MLVITAHAVADTINFDDLNAAAGDIILDAISPYDGFKWTNFSVYTTVPGFPGFNNGIFSPSNAAYSGGETFNNTLVPVVGKIQSDTLFDFNSAYLGAGYYNNLNVTVQGLLSGTVRFSQTVTVNTTGAQLFQFMFQGVSEVDVFASKTAMTTDPYACGSFNCTQFTLDDVSVIPSTSVAPEPSTIALFSVAALVLCAIRPLARRVFALLQPCNRSHC